MTESEPDPLDGIPYWTQRLYQPGGGQDHLGLGSVVTDRILPQLAPGINVLTSHPRYWSFYSFVLSEFWSRDLPRSRDALKQWYRPLECIFSVACEMCSDPGHRGSPVGSRRVSGLVASQPAAFDPQFDYMKTSMGGFGLYYGSVMQSVGLVVLANPAVGLAVDAVTPAGQLVADAFRHAVRDTDYYRTWIDRHDQPVPASVVQEYATKACLCRLREDSAPDRQLLIDVFLHSGDPTQASDRRSTLQMMCEMSAQAAHRALDEASFRRLVYFRVEYPDGKAGGATFEPTVAIVNAARRWRLYQAREYYNAAFNEMWRRLGNWGLAHQGDSFPIPTAEVYASLEGVDFESMAVELDVQLPTEGLSGGSRFSDLLDWVATEAQVSGDLDGPWDLDAALTEDKLIDWLNYGKSSTSGGMDTLAACGVLLALVSARLWRPELSLEAPNDWFPVIEGGDGRLGMERFLVEVRQRSANGETVADVLRWLTKQYVIEQHERVAAAKLATTGDTFRFRREEGRLRFFSKELLVGMNNSRFNALATFLYELGWSGYLYEESHGLTDEGERVRIDGDLPATGHLVVGASQ